jgi:hypothetical protein
MVHTRCEDDQLVDGRYMLLNVSRLNNFLTEHTFNPGGSMTVLFRRQNALQRV